MTANTHNHGIPVVAAKRKSGSVARFEPPMPHAEVAAHLGRWRAAVAKA